MAIIQKKKKEGERKKITTVGMQKNWNLPARLVGIKNHAVAEENSLVAPQQVKSLPSEPATLILVLYPQKSKNWDSNT